jgi:hypothetical protein
MHSAERRRGEGHEQPGMAGHRLADTLAAPQTSGEEVELVGLVGRRAGRTNRGPPIAAGLEQRGVRLPVGRVHGADLTRLWIGMLNPTAQPHRVDAVASGRDLLDPPLIARTSPVNDLLEDARQQLPDHHGLGHATSSGAGIPGRTRSPGACSASSSAGSVRSCAVARTTAATWW